MDPREYGLPDGHEEFREGQEESLIWAMEQEGVGILEAPTGSGKTAIAAGTASKKRVVALCRTRVLQVANYAQEYGFDPLFGKDNYPCIHPEAEVGATCGQCLYPQKMSECDYYHECTYIAQRDLVRGSRKASLNYAYYLRSQYFKDNRPDVLFLDEGHQLSELILGWAGCTVDEHKRVKWYLPDFPILEAQRSSSLTAPRSAFGSFSVVTLPEPEDPIGKVKDWLTESIKILRRQVVTYQQLAPFSEASRTKAQDGGLLQYKLQTTLTTICMNEDAWYIESGPTALQRLDRMSGEYKPAPGIVIKPLTARYHFPHFFLSEESATVIMSATIGNAQTFSEELGIRVYQDRVMENPYPPARRPVYVLDAPGMGYKSGLSHYKKQAEVIARAILDCPAEWSGIIHVTRKSEAPKLRDRLKKMGLRKRVWSPPLEQKHCRLDCSLCPYQEEGGCSKQGRWFGTNEQAALWTVRKKMVPGSIMVCWQFREGYDGSGMIEGVYYPELDEKICIVAKTPFPNLGNPYEKARQRFSGKFYLQRTAWDLEQALGRTRRGREIDYDLPGDRRGLVAIADGNYVRVQKYLSKGLREAITEY